MELQFENVRADFIKTCFADTLQRFPELHRHRIVLRRHTGLKHVMQAQPIIDYHFFDRSRRAYRIDMNNKMELEGHFRMSELPEEVLVGWFAHELGHVMDYLDRGVLNMANFGLGYLFSAFSRKAAERRADLYAMRQGFTAELLATKKFILDHVSLPGAYKDAIRRYYLSPDELLALATMEKEKITLA